MDAQVTVELLTRLTFGGDVAELEDDLDRVFLRTSSYYAVVNDEVDLVLGPKGSGKSAIARFVCDPEAEIPELASTDIIPAFNLRGTLLFKRMAGANIPADDRTQRDFFLTYIACLIGNHVVLNYAGHSDAVRGIREILESAGLLDPGAANRGLFRKVLDSFRPTIEATVSLDATGQPQFTGSARLEQKQSASATRDIEGVEDLVELLAEFYEERHRRCWVVFDRLDEAFSEDRTLEAAALRGLLRAHLDLASYSRSLSTKLFLRYDVMQRVTQDAGFANLSHIRTLRLTWDSDSVLNLLKLRILAAEVLDTWTGGSIHPSLDVRQICRGVLPRHMGKTDSLVWLLLVTPDSTRALNPRNLLTLLRASRYHAMDLARRGAHFSRERGLLPESSLHAGYEQVSTARLEDTVFAESPAARAWAEKLRGRTVRFTRDDLSGRFGLAGSDLDTAVETLRNAGLLRLIEGDFIVPPLYRPALFVAVHGSELTIGTDDQDEAVVHSTRPWPRNDEASQGSNNPQESLPSGTAPVSTDQSTQARKRARHTERDNFLGVRTASEYLGETDFAADLARSLDVEFEAPATAPPAPISPKAGTVGSKQVTTEEQRQQLKIAHDHLAAMEFDDALSIFVRFAQTDAATACDALDTALTLGLERALDVAELVREARFKMQPPHLGRLVALDLIREGPLMKDLDAIRARGVTQAAIAWVKFLGRDPELERVAYRSWRTHEGGSASNTPFGRAVPVVAASRVLALARGQRDAPPSESVGQATSEFWAIFPDLVRRLQGVLGAYSRDPETVLPQMLPYQNLSIAECLREHQVLPRQLWASVRDRLVSVLVLGEDAHRAKFDDWRPFTPLAAEVLDRL